MHKSVLLTLLALLLQQAIIAVAFTAAGAASKLGSVEALAEEPQRQHSLRHQEHYEQRIQKAVDDFKKERDKNFLEAAMATATTTAPLTAMATAKANGDYNKNLRLQQFNAAQSQQQQQPHHLRHEQHLHQRRQYEISQQQQLQQHPQQYHLRHHNRQHQAWEQQHALATKPAMRHQHHHQHQHRFGYAAAKMLQAPTTTTTTTTMPTEGPPPLSWNQTKTQRYFDRDSINGWTTQTTHSPRIYPPTARATAMANNRFNLQFADDNRPFNDNDFDEYSTEQQMSENSRGGNRFTLKLTSSTEQQLQQQQQQNMAEQSQELEVDDVVDKSMKAKYNINDYDTPVENADDELADSDENTYEDTQEPSDNQNEFPSISSPVEKASVKRNSFTNFFRIFQSQSSDKELQPKSNVAYKLKPSVLNNENSETEEGFSNEKWNKIEHEHHLRQEQRQKELLAQIQTNKAEIRMPAKINENEDNIYTRYTQGSVTVQKELELGTPEAVSQQVYATSHSKEKALADRHVSQMYTKTKCHQPQPRVVRIHKETMKRYSPTCTVLHRCGEDTGCCKSSHICAPKYTDIVNLNFYVHSPRKVTKIERMSFVNHTECHCVERAKVAENAFYSGANALPMLNDDLNAGFANAAHINLGYRRDNFNCTCPTLFDRILATDYECRCDCSSSNIACVRFKRGIEHFSMQDRKCIRARRCKPPTCEYGSYNQKDGSCPKQDERSISVNLIS